MQLVHLQLMVSIPLIDGRHSFEQPQRLPIEGGTVGDSELEHVLRTKRGDKLPGSPERNHLPVIHDRHAIAELFGLVHVVGGEQDGSPAGAELLDQFPELPARLRIEPGRRFIEKEELRLADKRTGKREPLFLPARKLADARARFLLELNELDDGIRRRSLAVKATKDLYRLRHGKLIGKLRLLQRDPEPFSQISTVPFPSPSKNFDIATIRGGKPFADLDGRRLPGAVRPEQPKTLPLQHLEIEPIHRDHIAIRFAKIPNPKRNTGVTHGQNNNAVPIQKNRDHQGHKEGRSRPEGVSPETVCWSEGRRPRAAGHWSPGPIAPADELRCPGQRPGGLASDQHTVSGDAPGPLLRCSVVCYG